MAQQDEKGADLECFKRGQQQQQGELGTCKESPIVQDLESDLKDIGGWTENVPHLQVDDTVSDDNIIHAHQEQHTPQEVESQQYAPEDEIYDPMEVYLKESVQEEPWKPRSTGYQQSQLLSFFYSCNNSKPVTNPGPGI